MANRAPTPDPDGDPPEALDFRLLGPVGVWRGARRLPLGPAESGKVRCILAVLLRVPGAPVATGVLVARVWGERAVGPAVRYKYVGWLRSALAPHGIVLAQSDQGYRLDIDAGLVDLHRFRAQVERATAAVQDGHLTDAAARLRTALEEWRGEALSGVPGAWADLFRNELTSQRRAAMSLRFRVALALGPAADLLPALASWEAENPTDETVVGLRMLALHRAGLRAAALECFQQARRRIRDGLDADPTAELDTLHRRIQANDPDLMTMPAGLSAGATLAAPAPAVEVTGRPAAPVPRQLPMAVRHLAGRTRELAHLSAQIGDAVPFDDPVPFDEPVPLDDPVPVDEPVRRGTGAVITVITGTAGVGKTALVVSWAHQVSGRFPDGQLYVNLRGFDGSTAPMGPGEAVRGFLHALGVDATSVPSTVDEQVALYRSLLARRRLLVVLDNAADADQVRPLLPAGPGCMAVVTSRTALVGLVAVEGADLITVDLLTPAEAHELVGHRLGAHRVAAEPRATQRLIELCVRLPLALSVASARAAIQPHLPLSALVSQLSVGRGRLDALDCADAGISVRAVFSWSYRRLDPTAARVFRLLGLAPGPDISAAAAARLTGLTPAHAATVLDELVRAQLLMEHASRRFTFHDLLRAYAYETAHQVEAEADRSAALARLLDHYLRTAYASAQLINTAKDHLDLVAGPDDTVAELVVDRDAAWTWFEAEHPVLLAAIESGDGLGFADHAWQLAWCAADYLHQNGYWHDWAASQRAGLAAADSSGSAAGQARSHQYLGYALAKLGEHADSRHHLYQALRLFDQLDDGDGLAGTHMMLAIGMEREQRYAEALHHAGHAVALRRAADQPGALANALNALGWYHAKLGQYDHAVDYCEQALAVHRELGNANGEAATWDSLGFARHQLGQHAAALYCYQQAVDLHRRLGDRYSLAGNLTGVGDVCAASGDPAGARRAWQHALRILDEMDHPDAARVRDRLVRPFPPPRHPD